MRKTVCLLIIAVTINQCKYNKNTVINRVTNKYTKEEINLFYQACFNEVYDTTLRLSKWDKNLSFYLDGDTLKGDKVLVSNIVSYINSIDGLPIKLSESKDKKNCNLYIKSGSEQDLGLERPNRGMTSLFDFDLNGSIDSAKIIISNKVKNKNNRKLLYFHELFHALGLVSHVTTDAENILFAVSNKSQKISNKDTRMLQLLYDTTWPNQYPNDKFEKDFADLLYHVNAESKFRDYVKTNELDISMLEFILKYCLMRPDSTQEAKIIKYPNNIALSYKGKLPYGIRDTVETIINEINLVTSNFQINLTNDSCSFHNGILISFIQDNTVPQNNLKATLHSALSKQSKPRALITSDIKINYNKKYKKFRQTLSSIIYSSVTMRNKLYNIKPFDVSDNKIQLKPRYKKLLKVLYDPIFPHNLKASEIQTVINEL